MATKATTAVTGRHSVTTQTARESRPTHADASTSDRYARASTLVRGPSTQHLPLQALVDEFLYEVDETLAAGTYRAYAVPLSLFLRHLREALGREPLLADLNVESVRAWSQMLRERPKQVRGGQAVGDRPITLSSRRNYLRHLRAFANWLTKPPHHYVDDSPLRYYKLPRGEETAKVPVEPDALRKLLRRAEQEGDSVCGARGRALLLTLVDGGLRAREIISLTIGDVSLKEGILVVRRSKGKKPRLVAMGGETVRALRRYALLRDSLDRVDSSLQDPFFQTIHGTAFTYYGLRSWLRRLERDTGVSHVYLHLLRHTSAIETLEAGADVRTVQLKLGHADIRTTQGYLNMAAEKVGQLQRAFSPVDHIGFATDRQSVRPGRPPRGRNHRDENAPRMWYREPRPPREA